MTPVGEPAASDDHAANEALDTETIDAVIASLLGADPPPHVMAAKETGLAVPVPADVPIPPANAISGIASALELCLPSNLPAVIDAWTRARARRGAQVNVHLRSDPDRSVTLHFVDARHRFGVYLGIFVGSGASLNGVERSQQLFRPRVCLFERDEVSVIRSVDTAITQILGWSAAQLIGRKTLDYLHPDDRAMAIANWMEMLARPGFEQRVLVRMRHRDGQYIWFEITNRNLLEDPACRHVKTEMVDVSERMAAAEKLRAGEQLLRRLTDALPLGVVQVDFDRTVVYRNELIAEILGATDAQTLDDEFALVAQRDRKAFDRALAAVLDAGEPAEVEVTIDLPAGEKRCSVAMRALCSAAGAVTGAIVCVTDVTERVRLREELERRAKFDLLTRCHNRASILEALDVAMEARAEKSGGIAVIFVDLDHFKQLNDRHGHAAGDALLQLTGERLKAGVRAGDIVGRLGGDEFLIVCPEVDDPETALEIAQRIGAALGARTLLSGIAIATSASIGVAWADRAIGCEAIVAAADAAMYEAKRTTRGPVLALG